MMAPRREPDRAQVQIADEQRYQRTGEDQLHRRQPSPGELDEHAHYAEAQRSDRQIEQSASFHRGAKRSRTVRAVKRASGSGR